MVVVVVGSSVCAMRDQQCPFFFYRRTTCSAAGRGARRSTGCPRRRRSARRTWRGGRWRGCCVAWVGGWLEGRWGNVHGVPCAPGGRTFKWPSGWVEEECVICVGVWVWVCPTHRTVKASSLFLLGAVVRMASSTRWKKAVASSSRYVTGSRRSGGQARRVGLSIKGGCVGVRRSVVRRRPMHAQPTTKRADPSDSFQHTLIHPFSPVQVLSPVQEALRGLRLVHL